MQTLTFPSFLATSTMLETQSGYTTTVMNFALWSLSISSLTLSASFGLNHINLCLTGLAPRFSGSRCSTRADCRPGMSSYLKANTSTNSYRICTISTCSYGLKLALMSIGFGSSVVPRLTSMVSSSTALVCSSYLSIRCLSRSESVSWSSSSSLQLTSSYASIPAHFLDRSNSLLGKPC